MQQVKQNSRRFWLAVWLQDRRRNRTPVVRIELSSDGHGYLTWLCNVDVPLGFTVCHSFDGVAWNDSFDGSDGSQANENGCAGYFRVARSDEEGRVILPYSNVVYSDGL